MVTISAACPWIAFVLDPTDLNFLSLVIRWGEAICWHMTNFSTYKKILQILIPLKSFNFHVSYNFLKFLANTFLIDGPKISCIYSSSLWIQKILNLSAVSAFNVRRIFHLTIFPCFRIFCATFFRANVIATFFNYMKNIVSRE